MAGVRASMSFKVIPSGVRAVEIESGRVAMGLAVNAVEEQARLNTPGMGRTPYEPTSKQTGRMRGSFSTNVSPTGAVGTVTNSTPYSLRHEFRIVKSGRRKAYLRPALTQAKI